MVLNSIAYQTLKPDKVTLILSEYYRRFDKTLGDEEFSIINDLKQKYPFLEVKIFDDMGPFTNMAYSLSHEPESTTIVGCDDDCIYSETWFEGLINGANKYPHAAIGYRGRKIKGMRYLRDTLALESGEIEKDYEQVNLITGVAGCVYRPSFFKKDFLQEWQYKSNKHSFIFYNDDIWMGAQLAKNKIPLFIIKNPEVRIAARTIRTQTIVKQNRHDKSKTFCFMRLETPLIYDTGQLKRNYRHLRYFKHLWDYNL